ncbi:Acetyltransferase (GNAT) family protein [Klenkia marina]|uniref:Acetyltransferase (GNAT) family protein n=1 Tax=Klenkia marina TaxID=1960309 RepID=A0A1G4Z1Z6_9ACTN|nr:GNAT family N-acetyltransferase [Klenkia marina]SCX59707.1 Acetyltransferase (GNAT) family protein [Klenkia marina]
MRVRRAEDDDLPLLAAVERAADQLFVPLGMTDFPPPATPQQRAAAWRVLVEGRPPRGFAVLDQVDGAVHVEQLSVDPAHGRQGIGAALLAATVDAAREAGADRVTLCTYADVPWNGPFYARHGFVEVAEPTPGLAALLAHEVELGLDRYGRRAAMARPV